MVSWLGLDFFARISAIRGSCQEALNGLSQPLGIVKASRESTCMEPDLRVENTLIKSMYVGFLYQES